MYTPEEFKTATITGHFGLLRKTRAGNNMVIVAPSFSINSVSKCFRPRENEKPTFSNSSGLKRGFEKLRFCDGLVWTAGLTLEIKLRFEIPLA